MGGGGGRGRIPGFMVGHLGKYFFVWEGGGEGWLDLRRDFFGLKYLV